MARPREFEEAAVLEAAMSLFWRKGFEATSTRDLGDAMGLSTASLYNAYGDKRSLYRRVLARYSGDALAWCHATLSAPGPARDALRRFFDSIGQETLAQVDPRGCLLVNAGLELAPHDPEFQAAVADVFRQIEASLRSCIERGQRDGSVAQGLSADDLASLLLGQMLALRVLARGAPELGLVHGMVGAVDALLDPTGFDRARRP
jgi:TetR/AcrR family transcriptional repressor of nem operon